MEGENITDLYMVSVTYVLLLVAAFVLFELWYRKSSGCSARSRGEIKTTGVWDNILTIRDNPSFLKLLTAFIVNSLGAALPAALFLFFAEYRLEVSEEKAYLALLIYFGTGFLTFPFWLWLSRKIEKKHAWFFAQFVNAGSFLPVVFLEAGDYGIFIFLVSCSALGFGGVTVIPSIIQADIIEYTKKATGRNVEGTYVGVWSVAKKMSQAVGAGAGVFLLGVSGFVPGEAIGYFSKVMISILYSLVPSICSIASVYIAWDLSLHAVRVKENS